MKRIINIIALIITLGAGVTACVNGSKNHDLDGQWQIMTIEFADGTSESPARMYYCIYLHTVNVTSPVLDPQTANMTYSGDDLILSFPYYEEGMLLPWGMDSAETHFKVRYLTPSKLIIESDYATITMRKF